MNTEASFQTVEPPAPSSVAPGKLYSTGQIAGAAFVGSPLAACWLLGRNYAALGQRRSGQITVFFGIVSTALLMVLAFTLPEHFPKNILPIAYTTALRELAKRLQGEAYAAHAKIGGARQSNWRVAGISGACLLIVLTVVIGVSLLLPE